MILPRNLSSKKPIQIDPPKPKEKPKKETYSYTRSRQFSHGVVRVSFTLDQPASSTILAVLRYITLGFARRASDAFSHEAEFRDE
jgi:hypothetical protein